MHTVVSGDGLETRYSAAPRVSVSTQEDGRPRLDLEFVSAPRVAGEVGRTTHVAFDEVLEYHWMDFEFGLSMGNDRDTRFRLVEITDSTLVRRILEEGKFSSRPAGQRAGGVLDEAGIRHYRICFDDHGTYDVICTGLAISHAESAEAYP